MLFLSIGSFSLWSVFQHHHDQLVSIRDQSGRGMTVVETVSQSPREL